MFAVEQVYQIVENEDEAILKHHIEHVYSLFTVGRFIPEAAFDTVYGVKRCLSGMSGPFQNAIFGLPQTKDWDGCIEEQLKYFKAVNIPFVWCIDEDAGAEFKQKLREHGFQDAGVLRGVMGPLDKPIPEPQAIEGYTLERVENEADLEAFNQLVSSTFAIVEGDRDFYKTIMKHPKMHNWVAKKEGKVVSAVTTMIDGDLVSFWNGATLPEERGHGLSTALRQMALNDAISKGCHFGASYLMADGLAFGICTKLGYEIKWRFSAFIAP